ncbi:MAG TPA: DNA polymerase III subunit beta [bacterium]|nr:DNA polymerase III subunit beta [bacterium]
MKLIIERDSFIKSLSKVQGIVEKRNAMPILSNTLLRAGENSLDVIATDLEVTVMDKCPVDLHTEGTLTLNARKLYDIVKELPEGPVSLESSEEFHVEVKSGKIRFELMGMSSDEYPKIPDPGDFKFIEVPAEVLKEMVGKTIYATAGEEARFSLNGIFTEKMEDGKGLRMVATDGHRLAMIERQLDEFAGLKMESGVIMPRKGMAEALKILDDAEGKVGLAIKEKMAAVSANDTVLIMRLVDGKFPDYRRVIIEGCDKHAVIAKEELIKNLRRVSIMVDEKARAVKFAFTRDMLALESKNPNFGSSYSEMEVDYKGEDITMGFNDRYYLDIMGASKSDKIMVDLKDEQSPAIIKLDEDPNYTCVIMPMRL